MPTDREGKIELGNVHLEPPSDKSDLQTVAGGNKQYFLSSSIYSSPLQREPFGFYSWVWGQHYVIHEVFHANYASFKELSLYPWHVC